MSHGILLEAGTNEMEMLIFRLNTTRFGINVAKVREIIQRQKITSIPNSPSMVEGSFQLRERVLTLINLGKHFDMVGEETGSGEGLVVIVEFNNLTCGVLVDSVEIIHRMRWDEIEPPSDYLMELRAPITGVAHVGDDIVLIADFETVVGNILGVPCAELPDNETAIAETFDVKDIRLICADDSATLRASIERLLRKNGFEKVTICSDGQIAWDTLNERRNDEGGPCDLVLSDIEMPQMDGLHLTQRIRADADFKHIPVILFSSLITPENEKKCQAVGASTQVSKPDSDRLVTSIISCLKEVGKL